MTLEPGRYRPSEIGVSMLNGNHARLLVLDVPLDSNGYRPGRKTFDYKPMEEESYYVLVTDLDDMLWTPENVEDPSHTISGPHSRACGWRYHPHGSACSTNCPTCGGQPLPPSENVDSP